MFHKLLDPLQNVTFKNYLNTYDYLNFYLGGQNNSVKILNRLLGVCNIMSLYYSTEINTIFVKHILTYISIYYRFIYVNKSKCLDQNVLLYLGIQQLYS